MGIFHAYDVRGLYESEISLETTVNIGQAYADYMKKNAKDPSNITISIGHDPRNGAEKFANALADVLLDNGFNVKFCGLITTPMLYFSVNHFTADGGIMVTASHNPKEYIGFKFTREKAIPIAGNSGLSEVKALYEKKQSPDSPKSRGNCDIENIKKAYTEFMLKFSQEVGKLNVVIDCSNGSAGAIIPSIISNLDIQAHVLNLEPNGDFPNHPPDPMNENVGKLLGEAVLKYKAQFGIVFDGDADRVAFVDEKGKFISPDLIGTILGIRMVDLARRSDEKPLVLYDLRSTKMLAQEIHNNGGESAMTKVGHSYIKKQMRETDAFFAAELSGHYYFKQFFFCDSAIMAMLHMFSFLTNHAKPLSTIVEEYSTYAKIHETNLRVDDAKAKIELLKNAYPDAKIDEIDGVSITYDEWWCNVRASNTEPLLRLNLEANTVKLMEEKKKEVLDLLRKPTDAE